MASEKVLGFKVEEAFRKHQFMGHDVFEIETVDCFPVVSLEWLEKYCKEQKDVYWESGKEAREDLLSAAKRRASR